MNLGRKKLNGLVWADCSIDGCITPPMKKCTKVLQAYEDPILFVVPHTHTKTVMRVLVDRESVYVLVVVVEKAPSHTHTLNCDE